MNHADAIPRPATAAPFTALYTLAIFTGSFLLFLVQPMFARLVLPNFGGAPAVWNSALLFYQAALFAGYLWAHLLSRLPARVQILGHLTLFAAAALTLPLAVHGMVPGFENVDPTLWIPVLFALSIGPVFLTVSAQAPLLQSWYARTGKAPWFLYAASNAGSFGALIAYPLLLEPNSTLSTQTLLWSLGYILLAFLTAGCGLAMLGREGARTAAVTARTPPAPAIPLRRRLHWALLAAVPSGLLISSTNWLTTDIMAMPLFWVIPLALYLLTFVIAFGGGAAVLQPDRMAPVLLLLLGAAVFLALGGAATLVAAAGLVLFFFVALALHGQLAKDAPDPSQATIFYLWIAGGGVIGGSLPALLAPLVFDWPYEHPILLVASAALVAARPLHRRIGELWEMPIVGNFLRYGAPAICAVLAIAAGLRIDNRHFDQNLLPVIGVLIFFGVLAIGRRLHFAGHLALVLAALGGISAVRLSLEEGARDRSFFGVYTVRNNEAGGTRQLLHGTTLHGAQSLVPQLMTRPTTYYSPTSGVGRVMARLPLVFDRAERVGVIGLGTGTLACYRQPKQSWTFFEIDPLVVSIARDQKRFTYLSRCAPDAKVVLGDARLRLSEVPPGSLDVLAVDAFSSDSIPVHLLTREAFDVYARALAKDGLLLVHISNRFVQLEPVVASIAASSGWSAWVTDRRKADPVYGLHDAESSWVLLARQPGRAESVIGIMPPGEWRRANYPPGFRPWSDDYASIIPVIK